MNYEKEKSGIKVLGVFLGIILSLVLIGGVFIVPLLTKASGILSANYFTKNEAFIEDATELLNESFFQSVGNDHFNVPEGVDINGNFFTESFVKSLIESIAKYIFDGKNFDTQKLKTELYVGIEQYIEDLEIDLELDLNSADTIKEFDTSLDIMINEMVTSIETSFAEDGREFLEAIQLFKTISRTIIIVYIVATVVFAALITLIYKKKFTALCNIGTCSIVASVINIFLQVGMRAILSMFLLPSLREEFANSGGGSALMENLSGSFGTLLEGIFNSLVNYHLIGTVVAFVGGIVMVVLYGNSKKKYVASLGNTETDSSNHNI